MPLAEQCNKILSNDNKINLKFSEGLLHLFKKRWMLCRFKHHGEVDNFNNDAINSQHPNFDREDLSFQTGTRLKL